MAAVYSLLNTDFAWYSKVIVDPPEFLEERNGAGQPYPLARRARLCNPGIWESVDEASSTFVEALVDAYSRAGYRPVDRAGPEVLRVSTTIVSLACDAPEPLTVGWNRNHMPANGDKSLVLEVRDSVSGTLMGKAVERLLPREATGDPLLFQNRLTSRTDVERMFARWARSSAERMITLEAMWPMTVHA